MVSQFKLLWSHTRWRYLFAAACAVTGLLATTVPQQSLPVAPSTAPVATPSATPAPMPPGTSPTYPATRPAPQPFEPPAPPQASPSISLDGLALPHGEDAFGRRRGSR